MPFNIITVVVIVVFCFNVDDIMIDSVLGRIEALCILFLFLLSSSLVNSLSLSQKAALLKPSMYDLKLYIKSNMSILKFTYYIESQVHFDIDQEIDELVLETHADYVFPPKVFLSHTIPIDVEEFQLDKYYIIRRTNGSLFPSGHYMVDLFLLGLIRESSLGIEYTLHKDRKTKKWTYSIQLDLKENLAKFVMVALHDVNTPSIIRLVVTAEYGFHAYFVKQSVAQM